MKSYGAIENLNKYNNLNLIVKLIKVSKLKDHIFEMPTNFNIYSKFLYLLYIYNEAQIFFNSKKSHADYNVYRVIILILLYIHLTLKKAKLKHQIIHKFFKKIHFH